MTGNDIATRNGAPAPAYAQAALAISPGQDQWDAMQLAALAQLGIKDASEGDRAVFLHMCQRTGLDPFSRQIYMIGRNENKREKRGNQWVDNYTVKWTIQTGIDGWRVIRDRAERRYGVRGIKGRFVYYDTEDKAHPVWTRKLPPVVVEMTYTVVEPDGREIPYTSQLRFAEYCQTKKVTIDGVEQAVAIAQWAPDAKPVHMIEKCVEADAYRCAFPQDFAGLVLDDAMPPAEPVTEAPAAPPRVTAAEIRERRPQRAHATVVPADVAPEHAPWPGDAAPAGNVPDDPRDDVRAWFERAGITSLETQMNYAGAVLNDAPPASLDSLARVQATKLAELLARCESKGQLDAYLKDGTVPGSE